MEPETKKLLERITELSEENNQLLRKMNRRARLGTVTHIIYWIVIIGVTFGSYLYIQPYLDKAIAAYSSLQKNVNGFNANVNTLNNANPLQTLQDYFKK